ncbi:MAG: hypothetical protein JXR48_05055 [Candidatus Delongbacteria bacterium]|nr:hypothetical protein [Candidatus Delongbacteria bacterium]MBN2834317.1 hypothetical protein [Candidatus Delongbacteria bacterium]
MIIFYTKDLCVGGVPVLIKNLIEYFDRNKIDYRLLCFSKSYIYESLKSSNKTKHIILIDNINKHDYHKLVGSEDHLICTYFPSELYYFIKSNPFIVFWNVFPTTLVDVNKFGKLNLKILTTKLISYFELKKSLFFMDWEGIKEISRSNKLLINCPNYLTIPIQMNSNIFMERRHCIEEIKISYIGRSEEWKIFPLRKLIKDLSYVSLNYKVSLSVFTDNKIIIQNRIKDIDVQELEVCIYEKMNENEITNILNKEIDINVSMGTSSILGASLGIPTLLIDASNSELEFYKYKWLYETKGFSLGTLINSNRFYENKHNLDDVIKSFFHDPNFRVDQSMKCFDYVKRNHNIDVVANLLVKSLKKSKAKLKRASRFVVRISLLFIIIKRLRSKLKMGK